MGASNSKNESGDNSKYKNIKKEKCIIGHEKPINKDEIDELYTYESAMCKIIYQTIEDGKIVNESGTGFFCEINDDHIPFKKVLFTNNHVLNIDKIEMNKKLNLNF